MLSTRSRFTRRSLVVFGLAAGASAMLAACGAPAPTPEPPKPAEPTKPAAAAAAPAAGGATPAPAAKPAGAAPAGSVDFWIFDEFATGQALEILNDFIKTFEGANPGVKINATGKPSQNISQGLITGASGGNLPDGVSTQFVVAANLLKVNVLKDLAPQWNGLSEDYRKQFSPAVVKLLNRDGKTWGVPYTTFATIVYRNLTVLEKAGIDAAAGIKDWNDWLGQAKKVKDSGAFAAGKALGLGFWQLHYYGGVPNVTNQVSPDGKKTTMDPEAWAQAWDFLQKYQEFGTDVPVADQAATDLFISNKLAFASTGPWQNAPLAKAAQTSGLKYDTILMPGSTAEKKGGAHGGEFLAVMSTSKQQDATWKWITFLADAPQLKRWAGEFGRMNANDVAMNDPSVQKNALLKTTTEAFKVAGVDEAPFFFPTPAGWNQPLSDYGTLVFQKKSTPKEAAAKAIDEINKKLVEGAQ